ncbi:hypothetical protein [Ectobacillus polymachus]|uniref:hypothetical protein n=1 Tax=Ectobacillus polymachus TaxID=1508806 RepID=UPI003A879B8C
MPDSYPFNTYSGLLTPDHYKKIGNAIWLFLWCISSTTAEKEKDGVVWGIVKGNQPQKYSELALIFGITERTLSTWAKILETNEYIRITRAPYGLIFSVKNSKRGFLKRSEENFHSLKSDRKETSDHIKRTEEIFRSRPEENFRSNKDIISTTNNLDPVDEIANRYTDLQTIQEGHQTFPSAKAYQAIAQIVAQGVPSSRTIELLEQRFKELEEHSPGKKIKAFSYFVDYILEHHERLQAREQAKENAKKLAKRRLPEHDNKNNQRSNSKNPPKDDSITGGQVGRLRRKKV